MDLLSDLKKKQGKIAQWLVIAAVVSLALYVLGQNLDVLVWTVSHPDEARASMRFHQEVHREANEDYYASLRIMVSPLPEEE